MYQKECWIMLISRKRQVSDDVEVYCVIVVVIIIIIIITSLQESGKIKI